jgi:hypothetical protein
MSKLNYKEGDVFAVPLRNGGFALGLVARKARVGKVLLGYFWGPVRTQVPTPEDLPMLYPQDALFVKMFSDLNLVNKNWPIISSIVAWNREHWPMPKFIRRSLLSKHAWLVTYADDDPNRIINEEPCDYGVNGFQEDDLLGAGAVEAKLTDVLKPVQ